jgi:hypothetical protein
LHGGQHIGVQSFRSSVKAQPQMPIRIAIANEEPEIGSVRCFDSVDYFANQVPQQNISSGAATIELGVEPFGSGREAANR